MAYIQSNLCQLYGSVKKVNAWLYITTDSFYSACGANYFIDAKLRGAKAGDTIYCVTFTTTLPDGELSGYSAFNIGVFSSVSSSGGTVSGGTQLTGLGAGATHNATYTLIPSDAGTALYHSSASPHTWTIDSYANQPLPVGSVVVFSTGQSSGTLTIAGGSGVTLERSDGTAGTGTRTMGPASKVTAYQRATNVWELSGTFAS